MAAGSVMPYIVIAAVCFLVLLPTGSDAVKKTCMFGCMRRVISCKRKAAALNTGMDACCESYVRCYFDCNPDAVEPPSCDNSPGKRGSWSKRGFENGLPRPTYDFPFF